MNLRHIISKTSLKSSSLKNGEQEKSKKMQDIELLKDNVKYLSNSLENQNETVKALSNEKEKLYLELKSVQRINRNLKQQLDDEREMHFKEKEYLIGEIMKCTKKQAPVDEDLRFNIRSNHEEKAQDSNHNMLEQQLNVKDEVIYKICRKYMKMSYAKKCMQKRVCFLQHQSQKMCKNIISLLQENQETLDNLINKLLIFSKLSSPGKKYLHDLKSYGNLHYENMQLKFAILSYETNTFLDETKCRKGTSITNYTALSKSNARINNYFNFNGQLILLDRWRLKNNGIRYSNLAQFLRSKSDSCLVLSR